MIFETGIRLYNIGNNLSYHDSSGKAVNFIYNSNQVIAIPLNCYAGISKRNPNIYLGLGTMLAYNFTGTVFQNSSANYIETTKHLKGFKVNITGSVRSFSNSGSDIFALICNIRKD